MAGMEALLAATAFQGWRRSQGRGWGVWGWRACTWRGRFQRPHCGRACTAHAPHVGGRSLSRGVGGRAVLPSSTGAQVPLWPSTQSPRWSCSERQALRTSCGSESHLPVTRAQVGWLLAHSGVRHEDALDRVSYVVSLTGPGLTLSSKYTCPVQLEVGVIKFLSAKAVPPEFLLSSLLPFFLSLSPSISLYSFLPRSLPPFLSFFFFFLVFVFLLKTDS